MVINNKHALFLKVQNSKILPYHSDAIYGNDTNYYQALTELKAGKKEGDWMWFIFPQPKKAHMKTLANEYALSSKEDAREYLAHKILGSRLIECTNAVLSHSERSLEEIFGNYEDAKKFIDCMHLFKHVGGEESVFIEALKVFAQA